MVNRKISYENQRIINIEKSLENLAKQRSEAIASYQAAELEQDARRGDFHRQRLEELDRFIELAELLLLSFQAKLQQG